MPHIGTLRTALAKKTHLKIHQRFYSNIQGKFYMFEHVLQGFLSGYFFKKTANGLSPQIYNFILQKNMKRILIPEFASLP